ncbi:MAG: hypothetical protein JWP52_341, partial [Rhizobacter sp.]|nr:hypothetical protein [Rhizobacter sp.]
MPQLIFSLSTNGQCAEQAVSLLSGSVVKHAVTMAPGRTRVAVTLGKDDTQPQPAKLKLKGKRVGNDLVLDVEDDGAFAEITLVDYFTVGEDGTYPDLLVDGTSYLYVEDMLIDDGLGEEVLGCLMSVGEISMPIATWLLGMGSLGLVGGLASAGSSGPSDDLIQGTDGNDSF